MEWLEFLWVSLSYPPYLNASNECKINALYFLEKKEENKHELRYQTN